MQGWLDVNTNLKKFLDDYYYVSNNQASGVIFSNYTISSSCKNWDHHTLDIGRTSWPTGLSLPPKWSPLFPVVSFSSSSNVLGYASKDVIIDDNHRRVDSLNQFDFDHRWNDTLGNVRIYYILPAVQIITKMCPSSHINSQGSGSRREFMITQFSSQFL